MKTERVSYNILSTVAGARLTSDKKKRLTFGTATNVRASTLSWKLEEDWDGADNETHGTPEVLDNKVFKHSVPDTHTEDTVDVLNESKVVLVQDGFFNVMASEQRNLFSVLDNTRVREAELSFQALFLCNHLSKWRGKSTENQGRGMEQSTNTKETFATDTLGQLNIVNNHIQNGLGQVGVQF